MSAYNFKRVQVVPTSSDFIDIVLSKTQRKTPTVVHKGYQISRIRNFYMRKVKFTNESFLEKLNQILTDFPKLDVTRIEIHPFYADLMNVLYDKDHYKLALGQINTARHLIENVAKDYVRLLKFGDSLYRCKQLKRAALGRMATIMKRQKDSLAYLEQVRQHVARLPSIDPNARTLLICGYPNVGKSSFMNKVTRAEVEVQPYAFTTKSLYVGHCDYNYMRWQIIDTPGILDHPLEDRNTIEMQSITAMAHLRACILFFVDISESCGYSIADQVKLFESIKPLFANKPIVLVITKIDLIRPENLKESDKQLLQTILDQGIEMVAASNMTDEGLMKVREVACEKLLAARVEFKMKGQKINDVLNRLNLSVPRPRDEKARPAFIPAAVLSKVKYDPNDPNRKLLAKDVEVLNGGAGVYNVDLKDKYMLADDSWKHDVIPEILDGKNVADFIDPEIEAKLQALEEEEERLEALGVYDSVSEMEDFEEEEIRNKSKLIKEKKQMIIQAHRMEKGKNRPKLPKKVSVKHENLQAMEKKLQDIGLDTTEARGRMKPDARKRTRSEAVDADDDEIEQETAVKKVTFAPRDRSTFGLKDEKDLKKVRKMKEKAQRRVSGTRGESDRHNTAALPKHLFSGKRKMGTTNKR